MAGHGGDEGGSSEEEANGELFGQAVGAVGGVDEDEVAEGKSAKDEIKMDGLRRDTRQQGRKSHGGERDAGEKGCAVAMMKEMAGFEGAGIELAGIEKAVRRIQHPDGNEHGQWRGDGKPDMAGSSDEPGPESGYAGSVEREEMPEDQGRAFRSWRCGGHSSILGSHQDQISLPFLAITFFTVDIRLVVSPLRGGR